MQKYLEEIFLNSSREKEEKITLKKKALSILTPIKIKPSLYKYKVLCHDLSSI